MSDSNAVILPFPQPSLIEGTVADGFEAVAQAMEENFTQRGERGAACTVYYQGQKVVDLWGGHRCQDNKTAWNQDTLSLSFSVSKGMAAAATVVAYNEGLFELDAPVCDYWPEFAHGGKQDITVRQLLTHQAGLVGVDQRLNAEILADHDQMATILAKQKPVWQPGTQHGYHTLTLGWYQNELIRRVDPQGRSIGQFFQDEIAEPLGIEFYIGLPDNIEQERLTNVRGFNRFKVLGNLDQLPWKMVMSGILPWSPVAKSVKFLRVSNPATLGNAEMRRVEIPSANGIGQARAVAKVYAALIDPQSPLNINAATRQELLAEAERPMRGNHDQVLKIATYYGFGFSRPSNGFPFGSDHQAFGCPGAGGSFGMADPTRQFSFAYLTGKMSFRIFDDPRERAVRQACKRCIDALAGSTSQIVAA